MGIFKVALIAAMISLPASGFAKDECQKPDMPDLPQNGAALSADELGNAAKKVTDFSHATRAYRACLRAIYMKPQGHSRAEVKAAIKKNNAVAPQSQSVWDAYQKLSDDWKKAHDLAARQNSN